MRKHSIILILAIALGIPIVVGTCAYNDMVSAEQQVDAAWAQVENVLQRRADLIPNLVATVKGIVAHEEKVFTEVAEARSRLIAARGPAEAGEADAALNSALGRLLAISENYPELRSSENFIRLQDELAGTENRITVERKRYNDMVRDYNVSIKRFPRRIFAALFGFQTREFFQAAEGAQQVPRVDFGTGQ
jgi:LemA protein